MMERHDREIDSHARDAAPADPQEWDREHPPTGDPDPDPFLDQLLEQSRQDSLRYQELRRRLSGPVGLMGHMLQRPADPK